MAASTPAKPEQKARVRSDVRLPSYDLTDSLKVAEAIQKRGGGAATNDQLASYLGYSSTANGAFISRISAARVFGLIQRSGAHTIPTPLALNILTPIYPEDAAKALVEAFFHVAVFKSIYHAFKGRELPPKDGLENALKQQYAVPAHRAELTYTVLMSSAEKAGFFEARGGARTHLIAPNFGAKPDMPVPPDAPVINDPLLPPLNDDVPPPRPNQPQATLDAVKTKYLESLVKLFEAKAEKGEFDEKLTERIERILGL